MGTVAILNSLGFGEFIFHGVMNGLKYKFIYSYLFLTVYCRFFHQWLCYFLWIVFFFFLADFRRLLSLFFLNAKILSLIYLF
ncbi:putative membrane protein [Cloacibacterium normanense]|uniref:Putative membrane protein n=1 Tax=Cloacibacterium normanense TaxID=237258 RepID=A0A1E5UET8_9FLAO|nr:putative membrane protein [Cloacibacterium normanense]